MFHCDTVSTCFLACDTVSSCFVVKFWNFATQKQNYSFKPTNAVEEETLDYVKI